VRRGSSDSNGQFIVNHVPTPYPFETYTVVAIAPGYKVQVFDQIPVVPGAVMSLDCRFALTPGKGVGLVFGRNDRAAPYHYSHEKRLRIPPIPQDDRVLAGGQRIFATREGLVGRTTANGHVIRKGDRFASLPSRRALSGKGERGFQVPSRSREQWRDLPQGLPQAQAAFEKGYNGGKDGFGRRVSNPAGIDLADGTFWHDLQMRDNDWIGVEYLWLDEEVASTPDRQEPPGRPRRPRGESTRGIEIVEDILAAARVILR
jgi:hypothetical protein